LTRSRQESGVRENRPRRSIGRGLETGAWRTALALDPTASQDSAQVSFAQDENVVETLSPDRTDQALRERILPRAVRCRKNVLDPHALHAVAKLFAIHLVTVAQEIGRRGGVPGTRRRNLRRPARTAGAAVFKASGLARCAETPIIVT
jgi:hypothetical protein